MSSKLNKILLSKKQNYKIIHYDNSQNLNDILKIVADMINQGVDIIEFRAKNCESKLIYDICHKIREVTAAFDVLFVVFDRTDIAKLAGADGICLDKNTLSPNESKKLTEDELFIGYETKTDEVLSKEYLNNLDYVISSKENQLNYYIKTFLLD